MSPPKARKARERRGHTAKAPSRADLAGVIRETTRLWRQHHLGYDQTKSVVEQVRRRLDLKPPVTRPRTVERLDRGEVEQLIAAAYRDGSRRGLMVKTLFLTGARVSEFVPIRVVDRHLDDDPPRIHLAHAKGQANRSVPILPALAQELRTHLQGRRQGYLCESNRHTRYAVRTVQTMVQRCARAAGLTRRVHPHLLRHSIATILLDCARSARDLPEPASPAWYPITDVPMIATKDSAAQMAPGMRLRTPRASRLAWRSITSFSDAMKRPTTIEPGFFSPTATA